MWGGGVSSCKVAAEISAATRRRLLGDMKRLQEEPLPLAAASPCSDADLTLWNGVIGVNMEVTHLGCLTVPLHFLIDFPWDYPQSAPNIGFSFEFQYHGGAEYVMSDGRLKGKKVICLDILGNFGGIHTEWKGSVGSGWTPAYTVTTLLVQLQSVLCDLGQTMSQRERDVTYQSAVRFAEKNSSAMLELLDDEDVRELRAARVQADRLAKVCGSDDDLGRRVQAFAARAGFADNAERMNEFLELFGDVARSRQSATGNAPSSCSAPLEAPEVDSNICCFSTGRLYTETLLGVGVSRERNNLATAGELLSKEAFDGGLRQSTNKSAFEFFVPVWINTLHAEKSSKWREVLTSSYMLIGRSVYGCSDDDSAILEVFPRLINQLIVEMMRPDAPKSEAIATFEAMCNFWRTLRWLVDSRSSLQQRVCSMLEGFVKEEARRHKDTAPDLGVVLVLYTVCQGLTRCPTREAFVKTYVDENSLRWVMWWQRSGTRPESGPVFDATKVSRYILMFQGMVMSCVIGDVAEALKAIEATNCRLPERLEQLQLQWRERKASTDSWSKYFQHIGAPMPSFGSVNAWIEDSARRAAEKGPKYGGSKGGGKGSQQGKGKGGGKGKCQNRGW